MKSRISIIIPARNEERYLGAALDSIEAARAKAGAEVEIVVVANRCDDQTEAIAVERGCLVVNNDSKNLSAIRNAGVRASSGEIVVTMDADSRMSPNMLEKIAETMACGRSIGGGVLIVPERWSPGIVLSWLALVPIALRFRITGGLFFLTRETFDAVNGFDESIVSAEDIDFARRVRAYGKTRGKSFSNLFRAYIVTSCRKFDTFGDWYFLRNPGKTIKLLKGKNQQLADEIWYDFEH